jgi:hypothetical protein
LGIVYYATRDGRVPAEDFLDGCPARVEARFAAVLEAVRDAPPPQFSGGGYWEAMHGLDNGSPGELPRVLILSDIMISLHLWI